MSKEKGNNRPEKDEIYFFLVGPDNQNLYCTKKNTAAFLYENPKYDHIFYMTKSDGENQEGVFFWRNDMPDFDDAVRFMIQNNYQVTSLEFPNPTDYQYWLNEHDEELPTQELTDRQENRLAFVRYLLDKELLTAKDFEDGGIIENESL